MSSDPLTIEQLLRKLKVKYKYPVHSLDASRTGQHVVEPCGFLEEEKLVPETT